MIKIRLKNGSIESLLILLIAFCILSHVLVFLLLNFGGYGFFNSDSYADCQVSVRMWQQKTLFPEGWTFGNQCYVIATPVLAALMYGLLGDSFTAMAASTEIMTILIILSFWWMLGALTQSKLNRMLCCLLLLLSVIAPFGPYSINSMLFFMQASFYACYIITLFVVFGDYVRTIQLGSGRIGTWILSLSLCFATGMQSLRQTVIMVLPILAYELFRNIRSLAKHEIPPVKQNSASIIRAVSYAASNIAGVVVISLLDIPRMPIYQGDDGNFSGQFTQRIQAVGTAISEITSLDYILRGDFSRVLALVILYVILLALVAAVLWILRIKKQENATEICWILCAIGIAGVFLATILLNITLRSIYVFMWFPLVALSGLMIVERMPNLMKYGIVFITCILSMASLAYCYLPHVQTVVSSPPSDAQQISQWAVDNGYKYIYGEYWSTAPSIAVYSQGKLEAGCWHTEDNVFHVELSNTPQNIYGEAENSAALYVFTSADEAAGLSAAESRNITLTKVIEFGDFYGYISSAPLMEPY